MEICILVHWLSWFLKRLSLHYLFLPLFLCLPYPSPPLRCLINSSLATNLLCNRGWPWISDSSALLPGCWDHRRLLPLLSRFFYFIFLETVSPHIALTWNLLCRAGWLKLQPFCLSFPGAGITGVCHYAWPKSFGKDNCFLELGYDKSMMSLEQRSLICPSTSCDCSHTKMCRDIINQSSPL